VQPLIKSPFAKGIDGGLLISDSDVFGALLLTILLVALQALASKSLSLVTLLRSLRPTMPQYATK
jgi:hypothetical protein